MDEKYYQRNNKEKKYIIKQNIKQGFWPEKFKTEDNRILSLKC